MILKSLVCVQDAIPPTPSAFEVYGYDVLIDEDLRPWLIEVNASPSLAREAPLDARVKDMLIYDTIRLIDPLPYDRVLLQEVLRCRVAFLEHREKRIGLSADMNGTGAGTGTSTGPLMVGSDGWCEAMMGRILLGRKSREYGEMPSYMGNFERICPGSALGNRIMRLKAMIVKSSAPVVK